MSVSDVKSSANTRLAEGQQRLIEGQQRLVEERQRFVERQQQVAASQQTSSLSTDEPLPQPPKLPQSSPASLEPSRFEWLKTVGDAIWKVLSAVGNFFCALWNRTIGAWLSGSNKAVSFEDRFNQFKQKIGSDKTSYDGYSFKVFTLDPKCKEPILMCTGLRVLEELLCAQQVQKPVVEKELRFVVTAPQSSDGVTYTHTFPWYSPDRPTASSDNTSSSTNDLP